MADEKSSLGIGMQRQHCKYPHELKAGQYYISDLDNSVTATDDYMLKEIGMCRIVIYEDLPVVSWDKYKYVNGISERYYLAYNKYYLEQGSPVDQWLCTFKPIPSSYWEGVEMFVKGKWVRWNGKMHIERFVELGMNSINSNRAKQLAKGEGFQSYLYYQSKFIREYKSQIARFWEANKHKRGYIQIYVASDYKPYSYGFQFIEKRIKRSSFKNAMIIETGENALVHIVWVATLTQCKLAIGYEKEVYTEIDKVLCN